MSNQRVVRSEDEPWMERSHGDFFHVRCRRLGHAAGGRALGCNMFELSPGKTAMPFHSHLASEEALFVLAGVGMLRLGTEQCAVTAGDYVAFVAHSDAHQLTNTGSDPLRYLVFSTKPPADIIVYPDSDKVGAMASEGKDTWVRFFPNESQVDYWRGEPTGDVPKADTPEDEDEDLEQRIDDEIAALKKKLGLAGRASGKRSKGPKRGTAKRKVVDDALDELKRLKRALDGD